MPWCKYFIPKIAASGISPNDPDLNEHIMYAKCVKGHVIRDGSDWIQCENLPDADAPCWQEGGDTLFTIAARERSKGQDSTDKPKDPGNNNRVQSARSAR